MKKKVTTPGLSIRNERAYFDTAPEDYTSLSARSDFNAKIIENPHFASGLLKIHEFYEENLISLEKSELFRLHLSETTSEMVTTKTSPIIKQAAKILITVRKQQQSSYLDTRFFFFTSTKCKRLFSILGLDITNR